MQFIDRKAKYPGRWTMKKSDGSSEIITLVRNDEPIVEGTPMNANTLNTLSDVAGADVARAAAEQSAALASSSEKNAKASEAAAGKSASAASSSASSALNDAKAAGASASKALASEKAASSSEKVAKASKEAAERVLASIPDEYTEMQTKLQDSFVVIRSLQFELDALCKQHEADAFLLSALVNSCLKERTVNLSTESGVGLTTESGAVLECVALVSGCASA
jgi:hypothetical protein